LKRKQCAGSKRFWADEVTTCPTAAKDIYTQCMGFHAEGRLNCLPSCSSELRTMHIFHVTAVAKPVRERVQEDRPVAAPNVVALSRERQAIELGFRCERGPPPFHVQARLAPHFRLRAPSLVIGPHGAWHASCRRSTRMRGRCHF
jgi:hypothetical protein